MYTVHGVCRDISNDGKGVVKINKDIYFVDGLFPDEEADIDVLYTRAGVNFGKVNKLYKVSKYRIQPRCKVCTICGGCQYQQLDYSQQLIYKRKRVVNALEHIGGFKGVKVEDCIGMKDPYNYRNKIQMPFGKDKKGNIVYGFFKENSHQIIPVRQCAIENKKAESILWDIKDLVKQFKLPIYNEDSRKGLLRHVLIRTSYHYDGLMVVLVVTEMNFQGQRNFIDELVKKHPEITTIVENINNRHTNVVLGDKEKILYGKGFIKDDILGLTFNISASSFFQVNPVQVEKLYKTAIDLLGNNKDDVVLDAYSGVGTIGMALANSAKHVVSVELNKHAYLNAIENAKINNITNIEFHNDDAGHFIDSYDKQIDVVVMDPPRSGSDEKFLSTLIRNKINKVIYVSCDPETLARDLKYLSKYYEVTKVIPVDMFPMTCHCETITLLCIKYKIF